MCEGFVPTYGRSLLWFGEMMQKFGDFLDLMHRLERLLARSPILKVWHNEWSNEQRLHPEALARAIDCCSQLDRHQNDENFIKALEAVQGLAVSDLQRAIALRNTMPVKVSLAANRSLKKEAVPYSDTF